MSQENAVLLFDGVCNFCNGSVNFIIDHDPNAYFKFASLQSEAGLSLLTKYGLHQSSLDTMILIEDGKAYTHSTAALRAMRRLSGWPSLLYDFIVIPEVLRDGIYGLFARNRYSLFGQRQACRVPTEAEKSRFIL